MDSRQIAFCGKSRGNASILLLFGGILLYNKNIKRERGFMAENRNSKSTRKVTASKSSSAGARRAVGAIIGAASAGKAVKAVKRGNGKTVAAVFIAFIIALIIGVGACFFLGRNDSFEILGKEYVVLETGEGYVDEGVKIVEFGIDVSDKAKIKTDMKLVDGKYYASGDGCFYYIEYTVDTVKFGKIYPVKKIRLVSFVEPTEQDAIDAEVGD